MNKDRMNKYRVYIEEMATRTFYKDITAVDALSAQAIAQKEIDEDGGEILTKACGWVEDTNHASMEVREELTERVFKDGNHRRVAGH